MRKSWTVVGVNMLLALCGFQAEERCAWGRAQAVDPRIGHQITAKDAKALEEGLNKNPDNLTAREQLVSYYFEAMAHSRTPELEERREQHIFWLIEHHPQSQIAGSPEAMIMPLFSGSTEGYQRGKQLWLEQVQKQPNNQRILRNAAEFFSMFDGKIGRELLEKATALDPNDAETASRLAESYEQERMVVDSAEEKSALAQKALSLRERGIEKAASHERFYELGDLASAALEAGETGRARQYATELLQSSERFKGDWNYGNAVHKGNIILGRVALREGDVVRAKDHLVAAGETPGSPQLNSFGPNMTLAKELLEKGERDAVLAYLESCAKFWEMGGDKLHEWTAIVKGGGIPEFGGNLHY